MKTKIARQGTVSNHGIALLRLLIIAFFVSASSLAQATPLNLVLDDSPDITNTFINVDYVAGSNTFFASGFSIQLDDDGVGVPEPITAGTFDIFANIQNDGSLSGGTLDVGGTIAALGFNSGTLLTGTLTDIGFNPAGGDPLEFLFNVTGGDAAALFGAGGGIVLALQGGFGGSWASDFSSGPFQGIANVGTVGVVPVPAALWLFATALAGLLGAGKYRKRV